MILYFFILFIFFVICFAMIVLVRSRESYTQNINTFIKMPYQKSSYRLLNETATSDPLWMDTYTFDVQPCSSIADGNVCSQSNKKLYPFTNPQVDYGKSPPCTKREKQIIQYNDVI